MNGHMLTQQVLDFLDTQELSDDYAPQRKIFECLDAVASIFARETKSIHRSAYITTVAGQQAYDLPPDFIELYLQSTSGRFSLRYSDLTSYYWPSMTTYDRIYRENIQTYQSIPNHFAIIEKQEDEDLITGSASVNGAKLSGKCLLLDTVQTFQTTHKTWPRDIVRNADDGSMGYVLQVIGETSLYTALFSGTNDDWSTSDAYTIQPAAKMQIFLDAPSATAGHVIHVPYVGMPSPVFSDYDYWRLPSRTCIAIASGAASLFKLGKTEYKESQALGKIFNDEIHQFKVEIGASRLKAGPSRHRQRIL